MVTHVSVVLGTEDESQNVGLLFVQAENIKLQWPNIANPTMLLTSIDFSSRGWEAMRHYVQDVDDELLALYCADVRRRVDVALEQSWEQDFLEDYL
jgi:hypothetical protein